MKIYIRFNEAFSSAGCYGIPLVSGESFSNQYPAEAVLGLEGCDIRPGVTNDVTLANYWLSKDQTGSFEMDFGCEIDVRAIELRNTNNGVDKNWYERSVS